MKDSVNTPALLVYYYRALRGTSVTASRVGGRQSSSWGGEERERSVPDIFWKAFRHGDFFSTAAKPHVKSYTHAPHRENVDGPRPRRAGSAGDRAGAGC